MEKSIQRKCIACGKIQDRTLMLKLTKNHIDGNVIINGNSKIFGRSAYLCYNNSCIKNAFKKDRLKKVLKTPIKQELKGQLLNEL